MHRSVYCPQLQNSKILPFSDKGAREEEWECKAVLATPHFRAIKGLS